MKTIWKYTLGPKLNEFEMPKYAIILTVQMQGENPQLWAMVESDNELEKRKFVVFGTGHKINDDFYGRYIATFQIDWVVWHVFELLY